MGVGLSFKYGLRRVLREGFLASRLAEGLVQRERWPLAQLEEHVVEPALRRTLEKAASVLPAYSHLRGKLPHSGLRQFLQSELPIVSKADFLARRADFYPRGGRALPWWAVGKTSGTTGAPLDVFRSFDSVLLEEAVQQQHWHWLGFERSQRKVVLRGDEVVPIGQSKPPFWFKHPMGTALILSSRHLQPAFVPSMAAAIQAFQPRLLRAYPSTAYELAKQCLEQGCSVNFPLIMTSSERLYPVQRELMERVFGGRVFDLYGMAERVVYGSECEHGRMHVHPEYSLVEIVDDSGRATDGVGSLVGSTLHNLVHPLLRYRLSDSAQWDRTPCPCGRSYPVIRDLTGKVEDEIYDLDGNPVSPSVVTFAFKGVGGIAKAQVAQVAAQQWVVRLVPGPGYGPEVADRLIQNLRDSVSARLNVRVDICRDIPNLASGKFKWVAQEWKQGGQFERD